jgi:ABC-2 type transport system ATP-binding protein
MMAVLQELQRLGKTIIISSHILSELQTLCNRVAIIEKGRLIYSGPVQAKYLSNLSPELSSFQNKVIWAKVADSADRAVQLLRTRPEFSMVSTVDSEIKVEFATAEADESIVAEVLVKGGFKLVELRIDEPGLEEVFMRVTRGETQ